MHWQYYLSIENKLIKTNQFITHAEKNKDAYSDEFASIILLSCSELDSLFKQLCLHYGVKSRGKYFSMEDYAPIIEKYSISEYGVSPSMRTLNDNEGIIILPFENINPLKPYGNVSWWKDYQSLKHDRIKNVSKGNLINALNSVAAQFIILRELIKFFEDPNEQSHLWKDYWTDYWIPCV